MTPTYFGHNLTILREYKNSYNEVATIFFFWWCGGMLLYACVMPVCSIDAPAVSGVFLELWPSAWDRDVCIQSYRGYCRSINKAHGHNISIKTHAATLPEEKYSSNFIIGIFILPEDGQVMTETCRSHSKF